MGPLDPSRLGAFLMRQMPPADSEVVERGNVLPLGTYRTPDGQETTTFAFPQPMREGLDALAYALGYRQDPNAPTGYVTHDALNKGGQGLAESAMVGSLGARAPAGALRSGIARNADLDPSQAARMARAKEMGFGDEVFYHGTVTGKNIDEFGLTNRRGEALPTWFAPEDAKDFANGFSTGDQGRIYPVRLKTDRMLDARKPDHRAEYERIASETGVEPSHWYAKNDKDEYVLPGWGNERLLDAIRDAGWGGVVVQERPGFTSRAVYDPTIIRSVNAMFDPSKSDSANLLAANPLAGAVPLAWRQPQEQQQGPMMGEQIGRRIPPEEEAQRQALIRYLQGVQ